MQSIMQYIPDSTRALCSPFLGGASVELACAARGMRVYGFDAFWPLVAFWQVALADAAGLARNCQPYYPMTKNEFARLQKLPMDIPKCLLAVHFYVLNAVSYSGTTWSGGYAGNRFTQSKLTRLARFRAPNLSVDHADFAESIPKYPDALLYCDPPYLLAVPRLYGRYGRAHYYFNHIALAKILRTREHWILSYNDCEQIRALYSGYRCVKLQWSYGGTARKSSEILILSHDL